MKLHTAWQFSGGDGPGRAAAARAGAQYQVNNRIGPVNTRINNQLYGTGSVGSVRYTPPQVQPLESEIRYAQIRSGDHGFGNQLRPLQVGPLPSSGSLVLHTQAPRLLQRAMKGGPALADGGPGLQRPNAVPPPAVSSVTTSTRKRLRLSVVSSSSPATPVGPGRRRRPDRTP